MPGFETKHNAYVRRGGSAATRHSGDRGHQPAELFRWRQFVEHEYVNRRIHVNHWVGRPVSCLT